MKSVDEMPCAPWTDDQVESLNAFQHCGFFHEFTSASGKVLIATQAGWIEVEGGPVVQTWAHAFMLDWSWRRSAPFGLDLLESDEET